MYAGRQLWEGKGLSLMAERRLLPGNICAGLSWIHLTLVFTSMLQYKVFSISFNARSGLPDASYHRILHVRPRKKGAKEHYQEILRLYPILSGKQMWVQLGIHAAHPERPPALISGTCLRAGGRPLAFGHAELQLLLPPGQILFVFCSDVNTESGNRVTPKSRIHVHVSQRGKWNLGEASQTWKTNFCYTGLSMERRLYQHLVLSSVTFEHFE